MNLNDYLYEVKIGKDANIEEIFNEALKQIFAPAYLNKIENTLLNRIDIKEKRANSNTVAWNKGMKIFVNKNEFDKRGTSAKIKYLLHEFLHVLQHSRKGIFFKQFKEMSNLSKKLYDIAKKYTENVGEFLTGKNVPAKFINHEETLSYLMNDSFNWSKINSEGKKKFLEELKKSGIFNLNTDFWKKRLR